MRERIEIEGVSFEVFSEQNGSFWDQVKSGGWEAETLRFFRENITAETLVLDIGAWIGPTALYAAQIGESCIAFEPDPIAFAELRANRHANEKAEWISRLTIMNEAITVDGKPLSLGSRGGGGDSMTSALFADEETNWIVPSRRVPDILEQFARPGQPVFLKIDIEGGEYSLLPAIGDILAREGVRVHLSLHPRFLRKSLRRKFSSLFWPIRFLAARRAFVQHHKAIVASLPKNKRLGIKGNKSTGMLLVIAALTGRFPKEIQIV